ncbi:hypothetical protein ACJJIW_20080 [Microbulbifer sp. JMSA004]|uniref:hypothetical protein n=1 Tax=unclassified Microbulbifer TaxID=2619833 RepID=UPI0024ACC7B9|nr:hypothetical protein [Microbulbifer sp. VAAF005]WHI46629.1 hypothetical protein P0078_23470 [Microbulbifer sp. VAAF005]
MSFLKEVFPRGPNFRSARRVEKILSGSKLSFMVPPPADPFSSAQKWEVEPDEIDILNTKNFQPISYRSSMNLDDKIDFPHISYLRIFSSCWGFKGVPIIGGYSGNVRLIIDVNSVEDIPVNESLFDSRVLAKEVYRKYELEDLHDFHKGLNDDLFDLTQYRWPSYLGPVNCQWVKQANKNWLYFESQPLRRKFDKLSWYTALTDKHFLSIKFNITRSASNSGNSYRINQRVSWKNYISFAQRIVDSLDLVLTSDLSKRLYQVQEQSGAKDKPILSFSAKQVEDAKYVMRMWSDSGYTDPSKGEGEDHRASASEVSSFIDKRIQPRPLHNSYPLGNKIEVVSRIPTEYLHQPLIHHE